MYINRCCRIAGPLVFAFLTCFTGHAQQPPLIEREPKWWSKPATSIWNAGRVNQDNSAPINVGQLKHVASRAKIYLDNILGPYVVAPDTGAGPEITARVAGFQSGAENAAVANVGQLKAVSDLFYRRLNELGITANDQGADAASEVVQRLNGSGLSLRIPGATVPSEYRVPWAVPALLSEHAAAANIGQLKLVFGFELDSDDDGLLDDYERFIIAGRPADGFTDLASVTPQNANPNGDLNGDEIQTRVEFLRRSNPFSTVVVSEDDLRTAAQNNQPIIRVTQDIDILSTLPLVINAGSSLDFAPGCRLRKAVANASIIINSLLPNRPEQFFAPGTHQWEPGEIRGLMGGADRLAEWWGARPGGWTSNPAPEDDTRGINCAVGAVGVDTSAGPPIFPHTVQLGGGVYYISCPIIMTNTQCTLRGRDSFGTAIGTYPGSGNPEGWRWIDHKSQFNWFERNPPGSGDVELKDSPNHVAIVYIGGASFSTGNPYPYPSFLLHRNPEAAALTNVYDIYFQPLAESADLDPQAVPPATDNTRMSLISCLHRSEGTSSVSNGTVLEGINGGAYAAHGVGFCKFTTVNGLTIRSFHMNGYGPESSAPGNQIFLPPDTDNCKIEKGTVGGGHHKFFPPTGHPTLDIVGIVVQGTNVHVSSIHVEHCHVGVDIVGSENPRTTPAEVTATNIDDWVTDPDPPPAERDVSWAPRNATVRIRSFLKEDQAPDDSHQLNVTVKNAFTQNSGAIDGYGNPSNHNLLYEHGVEFNPGNTLPGEVRAFTESTGRPSMTYYSRIYQNGTLVRKKLF